MILSCNDDLIDEELYREPSKSAKKREMLALQALGQALAALSDKHFRKIEFPEDKLREALEAYRAIPAKKHEARRRQMQFIGKLMRKVDAAAIEAQLADLDGQSAAARHFFHTLEQWRDRLPAEPSSLTAFISQHPNVERQVLRQLVSAATNSKPSQHEEPSEAHKRAQRALFKFIRATLSESLNDASVNQTGGG